MNERNNDPDREIPEPIETEQRRATGMGEEGTLPSDEERGASASTAGRSTGTRRATGMGEEGTLPSDEERGGTRRATGMGEPGTLPSDRGAVGKARQAASGRLEEAALRVREMGDRAAQKNKLLGPTRPLAYNAAEGIDSAAEYVRTREVDEMREDLETTVRRHPLASVAVAFLAGYSLRRLF